MPGALSAGSGEMAWTIRPARPGDIDALFAVNAKAATAALPGDWFQDPALAVDERRLLLVAEATGGRVDGFCLATLVLDEASLLLIALMPRARGRGLGRTLLQALLDALATRGVNRCLLEVRETNTPALALYRACGFVRDGCRRAYYPGIAQAQREDAILMSWTGKTENNGSA